MKNVYIINSKYYHVTQRKLRDIVLDSSVSSFSFLNNSIDEIIEDASYGSLFSSNRTIIIKDIPYFNAPSSYSKEIEKLNNFLNSIDEFISVVIICSDLKKGKKPLTDIIPSATIVDLSMNTEDDIFKYLKEYVKDENITIDDYTLKFMITDYNLNVDLIINELEKLSLLHEKIDKNTLSIYSNSYYENSVFDFSNAVTSKKRDIMFNLFDSMIKNNIDYQILVGTLAGSFINMYLVKSAKKDGLSDEEINTLLEYKNIKRVYAVNKNASLYTIEQLEDIIKELADIDYKIKTGYDPVNTLKIFLLSI